jgi:hypothetical protein
MVSGVDGTYVNPIIRGIIYLYGITTQIFEAVFRERGVWQAG